MQGSDGLEVSDDADGEAGRDGDGAGCRRGCEGCGGDGLRSRDECEGRWLEGRVNGLSEQLEGGGDDMGEGCDEVGVTEGE